MFNLASDLTLLNRLGAATAKKLKKLGIATVRDLLFYFPFRYDDFTRLTAIKNLCAGQSANVVGQIELIQNKRSPRRRMNITEALVSDGGETVKVIWFNQPFIARNLRVGDRVSLAGKTEDDYGGPVMISPIYEKITSTSFLPNGRRALHTQGLVPNYHLTANLTQKQLRFLMKQAVSLAPLVVEWLPQIIRRPVKLISLPEAIKKIHFPNNPADIKQARQRLAFDELFLIQLQSQLIRRNLSLSRAAPVKFNQQATKKFVASLPFELTNGQKKAAWVILQDMEKNRPMSRLLAGEVGSGKTLVAIIAMLNAAMEHKQSVLMAPTEILARQHYETVGKILADFNIKVGLVTRSRKIINDEAKILNQGKNSKSKDQILSSIINNSDIIIGTHALIQENVKFKNLALAIIDEQHRFGVEQRRALAEKSGNNLTPHLFSMTATPIPRSLALALYGDLDLSVIDEMPKERKKIITKIVSEDKRASAYAFIRQQIKQGRQAFVVCPLIDLSDRLGAKSVEEEYQKLKKIIFPDLTISKLHGRLNAKDKEKVMEDFLNKKSDIMVATSVVEVGVDVPNASLIIIEGADRFGLAQIHQFRGRVGRSIYQSYCLLFTESASETTAKRLRALMENHDGFALAKIDLQFRGPGQVYGTAQKGFPELKIASLFDYALMKQARDQAEALVSQDPSLDQWPELQARLGEWEKAAHLE